MTTNWTQLNKPTTPAWTKVPAPVEPQIMSGGEPIGLLLALTYTIITSGDIWTKQAKPTSTPWQKIAKAT